MRTAPRECVCGVYIPNVHVSDSLGVTLCIGLGRARLGLVALWEPGPTGLARFLGLLCQLHDD